MAELDEDARFSLDETTAVVHDCIDSIIGTKTYSNATTNTWTSLIADACILNLKKLDKPYKYTLTCNVMQKNGAGIHSASSCYWDGVTDGICNVHWENDTVHCLVTVFAFAL